MTALDRQVAETAERQTGGLGEVVLTVSAWAAVVVYGLLIGLVAFVAVAR